MLFEVVLTDLCYACILNPAAAAGAAPSEAAAAMPEASVDYAATYSNGVFEPRDDDLDILASGDASDEAFPRSD